MYRHKPYYQALLTKMYHSNKQEAETIRKCNIYNDPICQSNDRYKTIIPQRRRLMEEYFKKMAPKEKIQKQKDSYMPSTVFSQSSAEVSKQSKSLRGFLREQHENRPRHATWSVKRSYKFRDSSQVKDALSYSCSNDNEALLDVKKAQSLNAKSYPYHQKNTFNRIVKGDPEFDRNFRSKYLFKPAYVPNCRKDNINELFQLQEKYNEEDETLPTSPNRLCFSQMCTITQDNLKRYRTNPIFM